MAAQIVYCASKIVMAPNGFPSCSTGWVITPYAVSDPSLDALNTNLAALNEFDPAQVASIVIFCFVLFIGGFVTGIVIRNLRRL